MSRAYSAMILSWPWGNSAQDFLLNRITERGTDEANEHGGERVCADDQGDAQVVVSG